MSRCCGSAGCADDQAGSTVQRERPDLRSPTPGRAPKRLARGDQLDRRCHRNRDVLVSDAPFLCARAVTSIGFLQILRSAGLVAHVDDDGARAGRQVKTDDALLVGLRGGAFRGRVDSHTSPS